MLSDAFAGRGAASARSTGTEGAAVGAETTGIAAGAETRARLGITQ